MSTVLIRGITARIVTLVLLDTLLIVSAVSLATYLRLEDVAWDLLASRPGFGKLLTVALVTQGCLYYADLYNLRIVTERRELLIRLMQALASSSLLLAVAYYWFPSLIIGRFVFILSAGLVMLFLVVWRATFEWTSSRIGPRERLLIVGTSQAALTLARELFERRHELGVEITGFVDPDRARVGAPLINPGIIGTIEDIPSIVRGRSIDRVVVSLADARGKLPMDKLLEMKLDGVTFDHLASVYEEYTGKIAVENLRPSWLVFSRGFDNSRLLATGKRLMDVMLSTIGLIVGAPIIAAIALAIRVSSRGPVFYHQRRVGQHGRIFSVHKFRSMREDAEAATGPVWASKKGDPRVTPIGRALRRSRLDELPQLWNVLMGDMSFVGPRPERPEFVSDLTKSIAFYGQRHVVRPGLTGWAQVRYTYGASKEDALEKLQYDLFYIKHMSLALDLFIIFSTIKTVVLRRGA
jgi:sugar transferase (PEP-CTERM system associated)